MGLIEDVRQEEAGPSVHGMAWRKKVKILTTGTSAVLLTTTIKLPLFGTFTCK
jgi:hypothetical protein